MGTRHVIRGALLALLWLGGYGTEVARAQVPDVEAELARAVVDRMPEGGARAFPADVGEVFVWMRVSGAEGTTLHHVWIHGEDEWSVPLVIGGSPWRTWSSKQIPPEWSGEWRVEIRTDTGTLLEALTFTVG